MKNIFYILFLCCSFILTAQKKDGVIGIKGGFNLAILTGDGNENSKSRISFHGGLMLESKLTESVFLQPEIIFSSQGVNESIGRTDLENRLNYINLPILVKFFVSESFSFDIGPQFGILVSAKQSSTSTSDNDVKVFFTDTDYGLNIGASYKFDSGLNFSVRYNFGLKDIINKNLTSFNDGTLKNGVFQLSLGYYFNKK